LSPEIAKPAGSLRLRHFGGRVSPSYSLMVLVPPGSENMA
jgi:hypothetical protein